MDRGQWSGFARMPRSYLFFFEGHPGIFIDHRESGCLIQRMVLIDNIMSLSLYWGIGLRTKTTGRAPLLTSQAPLPAAPSFPMWSPI